MQKYRCIKCNGLMFYGRFLGDIEIKCRKCGYINKLIHRGKFTLQIDESLRQNQFYFK
jgi:phage FluMu protein Com